MQLDKLELVRSFQSPVYQGGTCYQEAAGHETLRRVAGATRMCLTARGRRALKAPGKSEGKKKKSVSEK